MLNADPVNPVWGPMCPWGLRYGRAGGLGAILSGGDPTDIKLFRPELSATGDFPGIFWLIGTAFALRNFLDLS